MRKQYFIDKPLQTKYFVLTILLLITFTALFVIILIFPYIIPLTLDSSFAEQAKAARILLTLHNNIWPAVGAVILIMGSLSIFITHKIAGPVYRFKKVLAEVSAGNLDIAITLRKHDDLKSLAEDVNLLIGELRTSVQALQGGYETMTTCINTLELQINNNQISAVTGRELIEKMQTSREQTAKALLKYSKH